MKTKWTIIISLTLFIICNIFAIRNNLSSDGSLIIGFPFTFYSITNAKIDSNVKADFSFLFMILNIVSFLALVFIGNIIFKNAAIKP